MTGILVINKPQGITSFGTVAKLRRILGEKKIGHSGTLDPMATGVMTVLVGGATRFCELLPNHDKAYEATLKLGITTDTLDITGNVIEQREVNALAQDFIKCCEKFKGEITQLPPMYSAVSVNGRRLYDLAREGKEVERPTRQVSIYTLDIMESDQGKNEYKIYVECSSGTYIRTLIADIGEALGCGAVLTALNRVKANGFDIQNTVTLEELQEIVDKGSIDSAIIPVDEALKAYPAINVTLAQAKRFSNGGELSIERLKGNIEKGFFRVYSPEEKFLGIGENLDGETLNVKRVYVR